LEIEVAFYLTSKKRKNYLNLKKWKGEREREKERERDRKLFLDVSGDKS
jgi:hypothetical protein